MTKKRRYATQEAGLTLLEIMAATVLFVGGGGALVCAMHVTTVHAEYLRQYQVAMNEVQGRLEQLQTIPFADLPAQAGSIALTTIPAATNARLVTQVQPVAGNANLVDVHVAACWFHRQRRWAGEANCVNHDANWWVDSPAMVTTRIARRE